MNNVKMYCNLFIGYVQCSTRAMLLLIASLFLFFSPSLHSQSEQLLPVRQGDDLIFHQIDGQEKFRVRGYKFASKLDLDFDCFRDGLCALFRGSYKDDNYEFHYIDTNGKVHIDLGRNSGQLFSEGLARVRDRESRNFHFIDVDGNKVFDIAGWPDDYFRDGMIISQHAMEDSLSYVDNTGRVRFKKSRKKTNPAPNKTGFENGLAIFHDGYFAKEGSYVNRAGEVVIRGNWKGHERFSEGLAAVQMDYSTAGFIDTLGNVVFSVKSREYESFSDGLAAVKSDYKWGFVNKQGDWAVPPFFSKVQDFKDGYAAVKDDLYWLIIDKEGRIVFQDEQVNYMEYVGNDMVFVNYFGNNNYAYFNLDKTLSIGPSAEYIQFTSCEEADRFPSDKVKSIALHPYYQQIHKRVSRGNSFFQDMDKRRTKSNILEVPNEVLKYSNLKKLDLSSNLLINIPPEVCKLENLKAINLEHNRFVKFPNHLHCLKQLVKIDLSFNPLSELPKEGLVFENVKYLNLLGTELAKNPFKKKKLKIRFPNAKFVFSIDDIDGVNIAIE